MEQVTLCTGERVPKPVFITSLIALSDLHQLNPGFLAEAYELAVNPQHSLVPSAWDALESYVLIINGEMPADVRKIVVAAAGGSRPHMYLKSRDDILTNAE